MKKIIGYTILALLLIGYIAAQIMMHGWQTVLGGFVMIICFFDIVYDAVTLIDS